MRTAKLLLSIPALASALVCNAQNINTVVGNGGAGYNTDALPATATQLWAPTGVAVHGGQVYVADRRNNRVRMVNGLGTVFTLAGGDESGSAGDLAPATDARLNDPAGVVIDKWGNLYIADKSNNRVRRIDAKGVITTFAGTDVAGFSGDGGPASSARLHSPNGLAADREGNIYIADAGNNRVRMVTPNGQIMTIAGNGMAGYTSDTLTAVEVALNAPAGVTVDTAGNVYIADTWNYRIRKVTPAGAISTIAGTGNAGKDGDGHPATAADLNLPTGVAIDHDGNVYIAEQGGNRIRRVTYTGLMTTFAGSGRVGFSGDGGPAVLADMNEPYGLAIDAAGRNLYVAEQENNRVRVIPIPLAPKPQPVVKNIQANRNTYQPPPLTTPPMAPARSVPVMNTGNKYVSPQPVRTYGGSNRKG